MRHDSDPQGDNWVARRSVSELVALGIGFALLITSPMLWAMAPESKPAAEQVLETGEPPPPRIITTIVDEPEAAGRASDAPVAEASPPQADEYDDDDPAYQRPASTAPAPREHVASTPAYDPMPAPTGVLCGAPTQAGGYCRNRVVGGGYCHVHANRPSYTPSYSSGSVSVRGYYRKDGTYVRPHTRSRPRR